MAFMPRSCIGVQSGWESVDLTEIPYMAHNLFNWTCKMRGEIVSAIHKGLYFDTGLPDSHCAKRLNLHNPRKYSESIHEDEHLGG